MGLIHTLLTVEKAARQQTRTTQVLGRLAVQFRRDAHQALAAVPVAGSQSSLELRMPEGGRVVYQSEPGRLIRRLHTAAAKGNSEDWFVLPTRSTAVVKTEQRQGPATVSLVIESPDAASPSLTIDAQVSKAHRFEAPAEVRP